MATDEGLREALQAMMLNGMMQTWREGSRNGLQMAHNMTEALRNEIAKRCTDDCAAEQRIAYEAQIAVLRGLRTALITAAEQAVEEP